MQLYFTRAKTYSSWRKHIILLICNFIHALLNIFCVINIKIDHNRLQIGDKKLPMGQKLQDGKKCSKFPGTIFKGVRVMALSSDVNNLETGYPYYLEFGVARDIKD